MQISKILLLNHLPIIFARVKDYIDAVLPKAATNTTTGIVKPGIGLAVDIDGTINVTGEAPIQSSALPIATRATKGAIIVGDNITIDDIGRISVASLPTKVSQLQNDSNFQTADQVADTVATVVEVEVNKVVGGAPETYDTLKEIADYIEDHKDVETALNAAIALKADKTSVYDKTTADSRFIKVTDITVATESEVVEELTKVFGAIT